MALSIRIAFPNYNEGLQHLSQIVHEVDHSHRLPEL
jgi:hypothetical protein